MPIHLNQHIIVDQINAKARVITQTISGATARAEQLQPGDKVSFTSDAPDAEIRYKKYDRHERVPSNTQEGSPFGDELPAGQRHRVADGVTGGRMFTVKKACGFDSHFTFECGHDVHGSFEPWSGAGGGTPGPDA